MDAALQMPVGEGQGRVVHAEGRWVLRRRPGVGLVLGSTGADALPLLRRLFAWRERFDAAWSTVPLRLDDDLATPTLLLGDPGGEPLSSLLGRPWTVPAFLATATGMAQALAELHARGLVHHGLQPSCFLVDAAAQRVWLTGFWQAGPREAGAAAAATASGERWTWAAPEQTGLMNRSVGPRSDLYALGVCLYQMLTGEAPFRGSDAMELMHAHLARAPEPAVVRVPQLPGPLSALVARLLAKAPEDRYQTASGLLADLRVCSRAWHEAGRLDGVVLGHADVPAQLLLPERLYGRERPLQALRTLLQDVSGSGQSRLVLVSGPAGVGKSSLVRSLQRWLLPSRARFVAAKADPQLRETPYGTLAQALQSLLRAVLGLPDAELAPWRQALRAAVGPHAALAGELLPDLALLLEPAAAQPALPPAEQRLLMQRLWLDLLQVFARGDEPLVLFVDDLQWLDPASLDLVERLCGEAGVRPLLLVGAFRDAEPAPALENCLPRWRAMAPAPAELALPPLGAAELTRFVVDALQCQPDAAQGLAGFLHERTGGNPLFAAQLVASLAERGLLAFDVDARAWTWELQRIGRETAADSVLDLLLAKLQRLPKATQDLLADLACLGVAASPELLARACALTRPALQKALAPALAAGLLRAAEASIAFVHDRVRESAQTLLPAAARPRHHLAIARRLGSDVVAEAYLVVGQYNLGASALRSRSERDAAARLNLGVARRARGAGAPASALSHAGAGLRMLGAQPFVRERGLAFELMLVRAESAVLCGDLDAAAADLDQLQAAADTAVEAGAACRLRVLLQVMQSDYAAAVATALAGLQRFGVELPAHPTPQQVDAGYHAVVALLGERSLDSLVALPASDDETLNAAMHLLSELFAPACFTDVGLALLHLCEMVRLTLQRGVTPASAHGFAWFGILIGQCFGAYREGHRHALLAQQLMQRHGQVGFEPKALFALEITSVWTQPLAQALATSRAVFASGVDRGDIAVACFACHHTVNDMLVRGDALDEVAQEIEQGLAFVRRAGFRDVEDELLAQQRLVAALRGHTAVAGCFDGAGFDEAGFEATLTPGRMPTMAFWYWVLKAQARFYAGRVDDAAAALAQAQPLLWSAVHVQVLNHELFSALVAAQRGDLARLQAAQAKFAHWQTQCASTFGDKLALVEAELARVQGRVAQAEAAYERAIAHARSTGAQPYEGLAAWLAGRFCNARGLPSAAQGLLRQARSAMQRWGADAVVRQIDAELPAPGPAAAPAGPASALERLDLGAVMKLAQALAGEIEHARLVDTLMRLALEHAGASRGLLLRPQDETLCVDAVATLRGEHIEVTTDDTQPARPATLLQYVARSRRSVLLDDASGWHAFSGDPDLAERRPRSVLCLPLVRQTRLVGLLYLENTLSSHVFTAERSALLELLASQAAIALENARLYDALMRENLERRHAEQGTRRANQALQESESRFRHMAESSRDVIWITDLAPERVLYASPSFEHIWGRPVQALYADPRLWTASIHPEDRERIEHAFGHWIGGHPPGPWEAEFRVLTPGGVQRWIHERGAAILDDQGRPCRVSGISTDITERRNAEAALRVSQERFALAVAGSSDGIWDLDFGTGLTFMSERAQQIFGLVPGAAQRPRAEWEAAIAVHPDDEPLRLSTLERHLAGETPVFDGEWRVRGSDGNDRWVRVRGLCVRDESGRPLRLAGSVSDIDVHKRAQASLQQAQRLEAVGTLASGIAHDFNNILGAILGFGETCLRHARAGSRLRRDLECIVTAGERGRALVERILAFSRSGAGERVAVHVEGVVREALQLLAPTLPADVRLDLQLGTGAAAVRGDPTQVHQVVVNLATNALHAMPEGGTLAVTLRPLLLDAPRGLSTGIVAAGEYLVLAVADTGVGIAPEIRDRIFDPFVTTRKAGAGSGLGLSLVHGIVSEAGGAVDVQSQVGGGSCFEVYLPRDGEAPERAAPVAPPLPRGRHQQVLVVDDEALLVRLVTETLVELGYIAVGFTSVSEALAAFRAHPERFDAVVTDERMPELTGTELVAALHALRPGLPVVLMSGYLGAEAMARARSSGVQAILGKPVARQDLAVTLARALHTEVVAEISPPPAPAARRRAARRV